ncbi:hypothetical protein BSL78_07250 [Apostichopus japonicus]|uniref:Integrase catalytic domain-containing protein n=1 Tax=Stichopus japonicus TaxID=307972 RepID=A0A2G8L6I7_STIJA|nr:hypothetical protein BSL78_07250 [Apostichopus japonicus]
MHIKKDNITFFGLLYSKDGVQPDPDKIKAIQALKAPQTCKQLQEFLGIATYMAPFIPNLSSHTAILRELMKKDAQFEWTDAQQKEFETIKELICRATTLAYFDPKKDTILQVDASLSGLGAALLQEDKPICFASRALTDTEKRYANIEREMLAVVYACEKFHTTQTEQHQGRHQGRSRTGCPNEIVVNGWPERQREVPQAIRKYWAYRDELSVEDGLIIKGDRIVIPKTMQKDILRKLHEAHQGITKCQLRAKASVFWHSINRDIEDMVKECHLCQEFGRSLPREPLQPQEIPTGPWQTVGTDIFTLYGEDYLVVVDYYSKYPIIRRLPKGNATSQTVITYLKQIFSEHGIPSKLISDNGSQYSSQLFTSFSHKWGFQHVTSSPLYPQSNGMAERFVQTIKKTLAKTLKDKQDVYLALLCIRTTPVDHQIPSPAELLFNRKIVQLLTDSNPQQQP